MAFFYRPLWTFAVRFGLHRVARPGSVLGGGVAVTLWLGPHEGEVRCATYAHTVTRQTQIYVQTNIGNTEVYGNGQNAH